MIPLIPKPKALIWTAWLCFCCGVSVIAAEPMTVDFKDKQENLNNQAITLDDWQVKYWIRDAMGRSGFEIARKGDVLVSKTTSYSLKLRHGEFDPLERSPQVESGFRAGANAKVYIVQFVTQSLEAYRDRIESLGGKVHWFLAQHAHIVEMDPAVRDAVANLPFVRWVGPYHPAYRLEEFLLDNAAKADEVYPLQRYNIMLLKPDLAWKERVAQHIASMGGTVDQVDAGKYLISATLTPTQLFDVARFDEVLFIDRWSPMETDMNNAREQGGANYVEMTPPVPGYTGQGVRGEVFDAGFNVSHGDFASRPLIEHTVPGTDSHGAATSGIVFGDGTGNADARGMLPSGQGIVANYNGIMGTSNRYTHTGELVADPYYAVFQTSSVGDNRTTEYTTISADMDAGLFDFDIVHCQSQSNAGDRMSRPQAWAKNIISGGAANHYDTLDPSDDCWCGGASIGPATDGRIKPDLCAYYDDTLTTTTGGTAAYTPSFGGTSGATPIICGHVGLVFQMWSEGIFGNTVMPGGTVFENKCHMTTAKALLINTANQYPFSGTSHDLTRVHQGWGWPSLQNLYDLRNKMLVVDEEDLLAPLAVNAYSVEVTAGEPAFKATLVFADPAGNPSSTQHRINDLTLKVTSPTLTVYYGNVGLLEGNWSTPGGSPNQVDTVENVFVQDPEAGVWTVEIMADEVVQDSHVETPALDADYALVVTGGVQIPGFMMNVSPALVNLCQGEFSEHDVVISTTLGFSESIDLEVTGTPPGATVIIGEDPFTPPGSTTLTIIPEVCWGNLDGDTDVDGDDWWMAVGAWLEREPSGDLNLNGRLDVSDLVWIQDNPGSCDAQRQEGDYLISVTATASSMGTTREIAMNVSNDVPEAPVLTSPANGAVEQSREPVFTWNESLRGVDYEFQLASDAGFSNVIASGATGETTLDPGVSLQNLTQYFWRVRGTNGCGEGVYSQAFSFTTIDQPDYMTELFDTDNDLDNRFVHFIPNGLGDFYDACGGAATALPTDPAGGTAITLSDDSFEAVNLTNPVFLYGESYNTLYVGSNGFVTFESGETDTSESLTDHFSQPRVSALFDDLNPASGGTVSYQELGDRVVVTFQGVPQYSTSDSNTFQYEFFFNGEIHLTWLEIGAADGLAGLSEGNGEPADFEETDLTNVPACGP